MTFNKLVIFQTFMFSNCDPRIFECPKLFCFVIVYSNFLFSYTKMKMNLSLHQNVYRNVISISWWSFTDPLGHVAPSPPCTGCQGGGGGKGWCIVWIALQGIHIVLNQNHHLIWDLTIKLEYWACDLSSVMK